MRAATAIAAALVAALLMGTSCYAAEGSDSNEETSSTVTAAAAATTAAAATAETAATATAEAAAGAISDGSRFGDSRPASAPATSAPAPSAPAITSLPSPPAPTPEPQLATPGVGADSSAEPISISLPVPASVPVARTLQETVPPVPLPAVDPVATAATAPEAAPAVKSGRSIGGWNMSPNTQYHIQTDEGPERYFKYQTISGQYRKEKRLQDGTVVGTYGWVDPNGYLRLRDYMADNTGYRVLKTKTVYVGKEEGIGNAVAKAKYAPSQGGSAYVPPPRNPPPLPTAAPATPASPPPVSYSFAPYSNNPLFAPPNSLTPNNYDHNSNYYNNYNNNNNYNKNYNNYNNDPYYSSPSSFSDGSRRFDISNFGMRLPQPQPSQPQPPFPLYDGISATHNGFRYYLPRQYHEEENVSGQQKAGSFGYIDPFGIRRVIYYNTSPGSGFVHRKNNRYVGFNATPYDPRF